MVCNVTSTTKGASFASFMGCNVLIRREGALFSYLMGDNVQRRREKWVLCEVSRWVRRNGVRKWQLLKSLIEWRFSVQKITHARNVLLYFQ